MSQNKRIIFLSTSYLPATGGLVSYIAGFSEYLIEKGHKVDVFCTDSKDTELSRIEYIKGVAVNRSDIFNISFWKKLITPTVAIKNITHQIQANISHFEAADIIVVRHIYYAAALNNFPSLAEKVVFIWPLLSWRLELINARTAGLAKKIYGVLISFQMRFIENRVFNKTRNQAVLSISKKREFLDVYGEKASKLTVLNPGVSMSRFYPVTDAERKNVLASIGRQEDERKFILLTVCRLVEEKNIEQLIKAMGELKNCVLYVVGDGPLRQKLEAYAQEVHAQVQFFGQRSDVERFYRAADVFVLASTYEGFGHVFLEAMSSGIPIVGVKSTPPKTITATDEIIQNDINGRIALTGSSIDLAKALSEVLQLLDNGKFSNGELRALCAKHYSWDAHLSEIKSLLYPSEAQKK